MWESVVGAVIGGVVALAGVAFTTSHQSKSARLGRLDVAVDDLLECIWGLLSQERHGRLALADHVQFHELEQAAFLAYRVGNRGQRDREALARITHDCANRLDPALTWDDNGLLLKAVSGALTLYQQDERKFRRDDATLDDYVAELTSDAAHRREAGDGTSPGT